MKKMKRLVALLVVLATVASLFAFSISVSAEDAASVTAEAVTVTDEDALRIEKLEALGVIDVKYDATTYVTRRDMAEIIAKYMNLHISGSDADTPFRDVSKNDSAFAAIRALYDLGVIAGDEQLRFNPDKNLTYDEALVFVVNAIGYNMFAMREGGYPTGYHRVAIRLGMLKGLTMQKGTDPVSFPDLYKILEAALDAATVVPQYYGDGSVTYTLSATDTFLYTTYGIQKYSGQVTGNEYTRLTSATSNLTDEQIEIDRVLYDTPGYVYGYFLGYTVNYYLNYNSSTDVEMVYIEEKAKSNSVQKIDSEDILNSKTTDSRIYYEDEESDEYHIDLIDNVDIIYNNQYWGGYGVLANALPDADRGYIEALDNNNDGIYDVLFVYEYENILVANVDSYNESVTDKFTGATIELDSSKHKVNVIFVGDTKKRSFVSISPNDVLSIVRSKGDKKVITVYISRETVDGKIEASDTKPSYLIGDVYYKPAYNYNGETLRVGLSGKFYVDMNNKIVTYKYSSQDDFSSYGVVAGLDYKIGNISSRYTLKIFTAQGEFVDARLAEKVTVNNVKRDMTNASIADTVLGIISNGTRDGKYVINKAYVVKYTLNGDEISSIDTGSNGGPGTLNVVADNYKYMLVRRNYMMMAQPEEDNGTKLFTRFDSANGVVFVAPDDVSDLEGYRIYGNLRVDMIYGYNKTKYEALTELSLYSEQTSEIPTVSAVLLRGLGTSTISATTSTLAVITEITDSVDEDGLPVKKIYFNNGASVNLAREVDYRSGSSTTVSERKSVTDLVSGGASAPIRPGVVIQYSTNLQGVAESISRVAEYIINVNSSNVLTPLFYSESNSNTNTFSTSILNGQVEELLVVGKVLTNDTESRLLKVDIGGEEVVLYTGGTVSYLIYQHDREKVIEAKLADLKSGDQFIAKIGDYYAPQQVIIFR
ncbi:MAG: S-layer homology domain-containing protein [Clostridia bacterium]|nr:S-layer homology domain-containing protein [Clostridia bacterium]